MKKHEGGKLTTLMIILCLAIVPATAALADGGGSGSPAPAPSGFCYTCGLNLGGHAQGSGYADAGANWWSNGVTAWSSAGMNLSSSASTGAAGRNVTGTDRETITGHVVGETYYPIGQNGYALASNEIAGESSSTVRAGRARRK